MSVSDPTAAELLTAVNAAILALVTNKIKAYTINGVSYQYHQLPELKEMRKQLQLECRTAGNTIRLADVSEA